MEISEKANAFEFTPEVPMKYWLRTAEMLRREVRNTLLQFLVVFADPSQGTDLRGRGE